MTKEERKLVLKDLCSRLIYGVKIRTWTGEIITSDLNTFPYSINEMNEEDMWSQFDEIKPYLRPMSSMTEEEKEELKELIDSEDVDEKGVYFLEGGTLEDYLSEFSYKLCNIVNDWLNEHHFDYRGLIERGLALKATEEMYKWQ